MGHTGVIFDYEVRQQRLLQVCVCVCARARARARALQVCVSIVYYEVRQQRLQQQLHPQQPRRKPPHPKPWQNNAPPNTNRSPIKWEKPWPGA